MKVICNKTNVLMNGRYKAVHEKIAGSDDVIELEQFQVKSITKGSKWQNAVESDYRHIKTKTIKCTFVDHKIPCKKHFKEGKRYQIEQGRALGAVAGYVFDEAGDRWTLYREEVGFSAGGCHLFEAMYK